MNHRVKHLLVQIIILLITGCSRILTPGESNISDLLTPTSNIISTKENPADSKIKPSTFTETTLPSFTLTPTLENTLTPLPTLTRYESSQTVKNLLENNGDCRLPCWWGFFPGETTWMEARRSLITMTTKIEQGGSGSGIENNIQYNSTNYSISYDIYGFTQESGMNLGVTNGIITSISVGGLSTSFNFRLSKLLAEYGQPEKVYISTFKDAPEYPPPFTTILYYPKYQFFATYVTDAQKIGDNLVSCLQSTNPWLDIWEINKIITYEEFEKSALGPDPTSPLQELNDATNMSVKDFYQIFSNPQNNECIETPAKYWP